MADDIQWTTDLGNAFLAQENDVIDAVQRTLLWIVSAVAWTSLSLSKMFGEQQPAEETPSVASAPAAFQKEIKIFDTPQEAANALVDAAEKFDVAALEEILGPDGDDIVLSGEYSQDHLLASDFAAKALEKKSVSVDPKIGTRAFLLVGDGGLAIPRTHREEGWKMVIRWGVRHTVRITSEHGYHVSQQYEQIRF